MTVDNPFILNGYIDDRYFCDREEETRKMEDLIRNGNNVVLSAPRRIGKSDFIKHLFAQKAIKDKYITIYVDIYPTKSVKDFVEFLGKAIINALQSKGKALIEGFAKFLKSLQPQMSFDVNGMPSWGIGVNNIPNPEITLDEIFGYLAKSERPCIVAIDEFQQITAYPDPWRIEALLRSYIQNCVNTRFIFSGSQRHIMAEIFNSPARPFYGSVAFMSMPPLSIDVYTDFCQDLFRQYDKTINADTVEKVYVELHGVTAYVQRVLNKLFSLTKEGATCSLEKIPVAIDTIINDTADTYATLFNMLSMRQRDVMIAIAHEGEATGIQSAKFIKKYALGSASMVASATKVLLEKDMLTKNLDTYEVYDPFFRLWIVNNFG